MLRALAVSGLCLLAAPAIAAADIHISPMVGLTFAGKTTLFDPDLATGEKHPNVAITGSYLTRGLLGVEGIAMLTPGFFQGDSGTFVEKSRLSALMANVVVTAPQKWTEYFLRPFVSGGFGLLRVSKQELDEVFSTSLNLPGYNIGGGAIGFLTQRTGVRFDVRYYSTVRGVDRGPVAVGPVVNLRYMTASVGVVIRR
jgi:hypothetical protein